MTSRIRIAFIDHSTTMGGGEHLLLTLINGLSRDRFSYLLITPRDGPLTHEASHQNIRVKLCRLPRFFPLSRSFGSAKIFNPLAAFWNVVITIYSAWKISRILCQEEVDLVQTNSVFAHVYGGLAARLAGIPCVWYFHDLIEPCRLRGSFALIWKLLAKALATRVVAVSEAVLRTLDVGPRGLVIYGIKSPSTKVTNNISLPERLNIPENSKLVGFVGRVSYAKGLDILAEAAQRVVQCDSSVHFVVFGEADIGDIGYKQYVNHLIEQFSLTSNWHWMGYDSQADRLIVDVDLIVLPSRREALGLVLIEAGLNRKAVVASRIGGIPEVVIDNETGLLVPVENPVALADAIRRLLESRELAVKLGERALQHVQEKFRHERYFDEFSALYLSINN